MQRCCLFMNKQRSGLTIDLPFSIKPHNLWLKILDMFSIESKSLLKMSLNSESIICLEELSKCCTEGNVRQRKKYTRTNEHSQHRACLTEHGHSTNNFDPSTILNAGLWLWTKLTRHTSPPTLIKCFPLLKKKSKCFWRIKRYFLWKLSLLFLYL